MVSLYMFHEIRKLKKEGKNNTEIGRILGLYRGTVAKYLKQTSPPEYSPRDRCTRDDHFGVYQDHVRGWLAKSPGLSAAEVFELLVEEGYRGSYRTLRRRLKGLREGRASERFFEQEYVPGEQSQFDFKERIKIPFWDGVREIYLHFGTLPYSGKFLVQGYPGKNFECFMDGIDAFFRFVGGMSENIRIDNLSPCVSKVLSGDRRKYTGVFQRAIAYYGFGVLPCSPGRGNEKGDVERDIRTHAKRIENLIALQDLKFESFKELNLWLIEYCEKRTTGKIAEKFLLEKPELHGLLERKVSVLSRIEERTATAYGMIKLDESTYSVPDEAIEKRCQIILGIESVTIEILETGKVVAVHPRAQGGGRVDSILLEHVLPSLCRKPRAMLRWCHKEALFPTPSYRKLYQKLKREQSFGVEQDYLKILNLIQHTSFAELTIAIELALESGHGGIADKIRDLILVEHHPHNVIDINSHLNQPKLNIELGDYNTLIPGEEDGSSGISSMFNGAEAFSDEVRILRSGSTGHEGEEQL